MVEFAYPFIANVLRQRVDHKPAEPPFGKIGPVDIDVGSVWPRRLIFGHLCTLVYNNQLQTPVTVAPPYLDKALSVDAGQRMFDNVI